MTGFTSLQAEVSGGTKISRVISAATNNATLAKATNGQVFGWYITNINAAVRYLKIYDKATSPTVGTDTPVMTIAIPGNTAGAGSTVFFPTGIEFQNGIGYGIVTGVGDSDNTAVSADEIVVNLFYK